MFLNHYRHLRKTEVIYCSHGGHSNCPQLQPIDMGTVMPCHSSPGLDPADPRQRVHSRQLGVSAGNPLALTHAHFSPALSLFLTLRNNFHIWQLVVGSGQTHHLERHTVISVSLSIFSPLFAPSHFIKIIYMQYSVKCLFSCCQKYLHIDSYLTPPALLHFNTYSQRD